MIPQQWERRAIAHTRRLAAEMDDPLDLSRPASLAALGGRGRMRASASGFDDFVPHGKSPQTGIMQKGITQVGAGDLQNGAALIAR